MIALDGIYDKFMDFLLRLRMIAKRHSVVQIDIRILDVNGNNDLSTKYVGE